MTIYPITGRTVWRALRVLITLCIDAGIVFACYLGALLLRFDGRVPADSISTFHAVVPLIILAYLISNYLLGIYRTAWQYGGIADALSLAQSTGAATLILFLANWSERHRDIPLSVMVVGGVLIFLASGFAKLSPRLLARHQWAEWPGPPKRLLIVGAGSTGQFVAREFQQHPAWGYKPVCFVDDDPAKRRLRIHRLPVAGRSRDIERVVQEYEIDFVALAVSSANGIAVRELVTACQRLDVPVRVVPGLPELVRDQTSVGYLRELTVDDLLGREPVQIDYDLCQDSIRDRSVLITGAAGSIGSELARQLLPLGPTAMHLLDNNESGLYDLQQELRAAETECDLRIWIADVSDSGKLARVFEATAPQVVFHAAAYKHVHLMEEFPEEAFRVNVMGTLNVCQCVDLYRSEKLVLISTDKAVNPSSVMGATKRIGELLMLAMARRSEAVYCAVRFGNVLGSRGSAVPTFWSQIARGGPVTVTDPDAMRYFLSIPEAVRLVIQAAAFARSGQIYMLDMGEEIRVVDLAEKMIRMRGLVPGEEIKIVFTGLRPGEKLREELQGQGEHVSLTSHPKVLLTESDPSDDLDHLLSAVMACHLDQFDGRVGLMEWLHALARLSPEALGQTPG